MIDLPIIATIFRFEWKQLVRQKVILGALCSFLLIGFLAIYSGHRVIQKQRIAIDSIKTLYHRDYTLALGRFKDTLTAEKKARAAYAGDPQLINYRLPQNAVHDPDRLAALAIGLRVVQPYFYRVKSDVNLLDNSNADTHNPLSLLAGDFDLAFVLVYLLPLLVILLSYNVLSAEKEQGTYHLLAIHGLSVVRLIGFKLLFRWLVIALVMTFLILSGITFLSLGGHADALQVIWYLLWSRAYLFFWCALLFFCVALGKSSAVTALTAIGSWLVFLIILPSLVNSYVSLRHPVPLRADLASVQRRISEEVWNMPPNALADSFSRYNPRYDALLDVKTDTGKSSRRFICGYYDLLERRLKAYAMPLEERINRKNAVIRSFNTFSPAAGYQYALNEITHTTWADQQHYKEQVDLFHLTWRNHLYQRQLAGKNFKPADFSRFPRFKGVESNSYSANIPGLSLWAIGTLFFIAGYFLHLKNQ